MTSERLFQIFLWIVTSIITAIIEGKIKGKIRRKKEIRKKEFEQDKNKERLLKNYTIQNQRIFFWIMLGPFLLFGTLFLYIALIEPDAFTEFCSLAFTMFFLFGVLNAGVWKVTVEGENIMFRNSFGIIKRYRFDDITYVDKKRSGALKVYSGNKKLFTFDENIDYFYFDMQISLKGILRKNEIYPIPKHLKDVLDPVGEESSEKYVNGIVRCSCACECFHIKVYADIAEGFPQIGEYKGGYALVVAAVCTDCGKEYPIFDISKHGWNGFVCHDGTSVPDHKLKSWYCPKCGKDIYKMKISIISRGRQDFIEATGINDGETEFCEDDWVEAFEWITIGLICSRCGHSDKRWIDNETM